VVRDLNAAFPNTKDSTATLVKIMVIIGDDLALCSHCRVERYKMTLLNCVIIMSSHFGTLSVD
jgi:hypothetical protein